MLEHFSLAAGRPLMVDEAVFESERRTGHRNRAIAHLLLNFGLVHAEAERALDVYFRQCAILVTSRDLAMIAATLANMGRNPLTGHAAFDVGTVKPNPGHLDLVELEHRWGDRFVLVTQNVDGLHRAAGSQNVLEIHGSLYRTRCLGCDEVADRGLDPLGDAPACPGCRGQLRPDIVWFGEALPEDVWEAAMTAAHACDVLLVVGTSAVVHPAASLVPIAKRGKTPAAKVIDRSRFPMMRGKSGGRKDV